MIPDNLMLPLMEFIRRADEIPNLKGAVLFGSALEGDLSKKNDIDILLLFEADHNPEVGKEMEIASMLSGEISRKYDLLYSFSFIVKNLNDPKDVEPDFLWNVAQKGIIIWGKPDLNLLKEPYPSLEAHILITYSVKDLSARERTTLQRALFGHRYKVKSGGKIYQGKKEGLVEKREYRLGPGVLLAPAKGAEEIISLLKKEKVRFSQKKIWV